MQNSKIECLFNGISMCFNVHGACTLLAYNHTLSKSLSTEPPESTSILTFWVNGPICVFWRPEGCSSCHCFYSAHCLQSTSGHDPHKDRGLENSNLNANVIWEFLIKWWDMIVWFCWFVGGWAMSCDNEADCQCDYRLDQMDWLEIVSTHSVSQSEFQSIQSLFFNVSKTIIYSCTPVHIKSTIDVILMRIQFLFTYMEGASGRTQKCNNIAWFDSLRKQFYPEQGTALVIDSLFPG